MNNKVVTAIAVLALGVVLFWPAGSPKKVEGLYKEGEALYTKKDYEGAIGKYEDALEEALKPMVKTEVIDKEILKIAMEKRKINNPLEYRVKGGKSFHSKLKTLPNLRHQ